MTKNDRFTDKNSNLDRLIYIMPPKIPVFNFDVEDNFYTGEDFKLYNDFNDTQGVVVLSDNAKLIIEQTNFIIPSKLFSLEELLENKRDGDCLQIFEIENNHLCAHMFLSQKPESMVTTHTLIGRIQSQNGLIFSNETKNNLFISETFEFCMENYIREQKLRTYSYDKEKIGEIIEVNYNS